MERICLDKVFFVVYDRDYCMVDHPYDHEVKNQNLKYIQRSSVKGNKFEEVLRRVGDGGYNSWELRLKGGRTLFVYVNIIRYLQELKCIEIDKSLLIHDNNFMPVDCTLTVKDYIQALYDVIEQAKSVYYDLVKKYWGIGLEKIDIKIVQMEIPFEVYPCSVNDIASCLDADGIGIRKYNTNSGTLYINDDLGKRDIRLPNGLTVRITDDEFYDASYLNGISSGYSENKIQIKLYQKSFGLVRFEFTILWNDVRSIFSFDKTEIDEDVNRIIDWVHKQIRDRDKISKWIRRFDLSLEDIVKKVSLATGIREEIIYCLKDVDIFESCWETRNLKKTLLKKSIIEPITDDIGIKKRGKYKISPWFKDMLNTYKPEGSELFLPGVISGIQSMIQGEHNEKE